MAKSHTLNCARNLRQLGVASMMYAAENQMTLPATSHQRGGKSWTLTLQAALQPYSKEPIAFKCADDPDKKRERSYTINDFLTANPAGADHLNFSILSKINRPEVTLLFGESAASDSSDHFHFAPYYGGNVPPAVFEYQVATGRHAGSANYLFADGHVETLPITATFDSGKGINLWNPSLAK